MRTIKRLEDGIRIWFIITIAAEVILALLSAMEGASFIEYLVTAVIGIILTLVINHLIEEGKKISLLLKIIVFIFGSRIAGALLFCYNTEDVEDDRLDVIRAREKKLDLSDVDRPLFKDGEH